MQDLNYFFDLKPTGYSEVISSEDEMFLGNKEHYFHVGHSALQCVKLAILAMGRDFGDIKKILDLPCGFGRVMRMLKVMFPNAQITGCDLLRNGVDFCEKTFDSIPIYSEKNILNIEPREKYDLVWCGSLLTHLRADRWNDFMVFFNKVLAPGGILVFTTHGRHVADRIRRNECDYGIIETNKKNKMLEDYDIEGFGYADYSHSDEYGISISSPSFVINIIEKQTDLRILTLLEQGWDSHQDVIACVKHRA